MPNRKYLNSQIIISIFILISAAFSQSCNKAKTRSDGQSMEIRFMYFGDELNTFAGTYKKDLVKDGEVTVPFHLTGIEKDSILQKILAIDLFSFPDTIHRSPDIIAIQPDLGPNMIHLRYREKEKTIIWEYPIDSSNRYSLRVNEVAIMIKHIIEEKPEYKALPPIRGGYE